MEDKKYFIADDAGTIYAHDITLFCAESIIETIKKENPSAANIEILCND